MNAQSQVENRSRKAEGKARKTARLAKSTIRRIGKVLEGIE
jgi:hypothetical protein